MSDFGSMQQRIAELERENAALKAEIERLKEWGPGLHETEDPQPPKSRRVKK